jgi:2-haloacid dehalogenase
MMRDELPLLMFSDATAFESWLTAQPDDAVGTWLRFATKKTFKPDPEAYKLIERELGAKLAEVLFVSSNPWDAIGAKAAGPKVAWIERVTLEAMPFAGEKGDLV